MSSLRALGYARVSTLEERIENQVIAIEEFAEQSGLELIKIFQDVGVSGSKAALERELQSSARSKQVAGHQDNILFMI